MAQDPIRRVGYFHLGSTAGSPIDALADALTDVGRVSDGLLVLPEAFNYRHDYFKQEKPDIAVDVSVNERLHEIAGELKLAFVAGLMEKDDAGQWHNSAYLIDRDLKLRLTRKHRARPHTGLLSRRGFC